jgi:hypothetical protein
MGVRDTLGPNSLDQVLYIVLLWIAIMIGSNYFYDSPLLRLEIIIGSGLLLIWVVWAVYYRLEQVQKGGHR